LSKGENMETSESITKIAIAVSKMQGNLKGASKDARNPFHKSKYANLESVWDACREQLAKNELAVIQAPSFSEGRMILETRLIHSSGEWFQSTLALKPKDDTPQGIGSTITYAKRYSLMAIVGIADTDDDDGNAASGKTPPPNKSNVNENSPYDPNVDYMRDRAWKIFQVRGIQDRGVMAKLSAEAVKQQVKIKNLEAFIVKTLEHGND